MSNVTEAERRARREADRAKARKAVEALKTIVGGGQVNYDGPSGPLEFADNGDVKGVFFRYEQVQDGKLVLRKVG